MPRHQSHTRVVPIPQRPSNQAQNPLPGAHSGFTTPSSSLSSASLAPSRHTSPQTEEIPSSNAEHKMLQILHRLVTEYLLPANLRREAFNLGCACRDTFRIVEDALYRIVVWREDGSETWAVLERRCRSMVNSERIGWMRHVVVSSHDQGQRLADQLRRRVTENRLQSITGWNDESPIVLLFSPSPQVALCRWIPQATAATCYARPTHLAEPSDSTYEFVKSLTIITYFDAVSAIWGYPISSSHNILYRSSREASPEEQTRELRLTRDRSNDSDPGPTDFGEIRQITLRPNDRMAMNPFPLDLMVGLGKALSLRNSKDQDRFWKGERFEEEVWFSVEGFGDWRRKDDLVDLISDLCATSHPCLNLRLEIEMRCASSQKRPELAELEALVDDIIAPYCALMYSLFAKHRGESAKPSLVGETCNPSLLIFITHSDWPEDHRSIEISPTTGGETVEVVFDDVADERGRIGCYSEWEWRWSEDDAEMGCFQLA